MNKHYLLSMLLYLVIACSSPGKRTLDKELANQIATNEYFPWVKAKALQIMKTGLNAGDGYREVWIRDFNTFIELALQVFPKEELKENLLVFCRMLINGIRLPSLFDTAGKRPWELKHLDTMELWKFGDHKHYTSLDLLASVFNLESPKSDIDGSQVAHVYWVERDIKRIAEYCCRDVITIAQLMLRFKGEEGLKPEDIVFLDNVP